MKVKMARSYKHVPYSGDSKQNKDLANRKVRNYLKQGKELPNGSAYKKIFEQYDICDYSKIVYWKEYWKNLLRQRIQWKSYGIYLPRYDKKEEWNKYQKQFRRK